MERSLYMKDGRKYTRADLKVHVRYAIINEADSKNISEGGICIVTVSSLEKGKDMTIVFSLPDSKDEKITTFGKVRWSKEVAANLCESGIEFWDVDEDVKKKIREYINKKNKK
jgi:c-di-GMP-binding flagellar brake protein YcgR